jgi:hypothetical protein
LSGVKESGNTQLRRAYALLVREVAYSLSVSAISVVARLVRLRRRLSPDQLADLRDSLDRRRIEFTWLPSWARHRSRLPVMLEEHE